MVESIGTRIGPVGTFALVRDVARGILASAPLFKNGMQEDEMARIKILNEALWHDVPQTVITEAENAAKDSPVWITRQGNGHIVAMDGPGDPDIATGDVMFIAEVAPSR